MTRHPGEGRDPALLDVIESIGLGQVPAYAGMTIYLEIALI